MLVQYAVSNYMSIRDEVILNFSAEEKDSEWVAECECNLNKPIFLYKALGLVGPNASGKSNIIDSFNFAIRFIETSFTRKEEERIGIEPFLLDEEAEQKSSSFEFIFIAGGTKYVYGFSVNEKYVEEEYLLAYYSARATTIFSRDECNKYDFRGKDLKAQNEIKTKVSDNRLYLPVAAEWGYERLKEPYKWLISFSDQHKQVPLPKLIKEIIEQEDKKQIFLELVQHADLNISDISYKNSKVNEKAYNFALKLLKNILEEIGEYDESILPSKEAMEQGEIFIKHEEINDVALSVPLGGESAGTFSLIENISRFLIITTHGGMMIEDELGKAYHTKLLEYFLKIFCLNKYNQSNAQIFFSTHNTKVFEYLEPAQIYLVDKEEDGATFVKLLGDYQIDKNDDIELGYLQGRYGAVPYTRR